MKKRYFYKVKYVCEYCGRHVEKLSQNRQHNYRFCSIICAASHLIGKKRSPSICEKISKAKKGKKYNRPNYHHSAETRSKMSASNLGVQAKLRAARIAANPFWESIKRRFRNSFAYKKWKLIVLERAGNKCADCGGNTNLEAHHILSAKEYPTAIYLPMNGVCLCRDCHKKTGSWGNCSRNPSPSLGSLSFVMITIPHNWQEYPTVGNWAFTPDGIGIVFVSETGNELFNYLISLHEFVEMAICKAKKINGESVTEFDLKYESEREIGLHKQIDEPGDDPRAPYHKAHKAASKIEKMIALALGIKWKKYSAKIDSL
jgi:5-methylcytosine-specific restriction endonuclease McrA